MMYNEVLGTGGVSLFRVIIPFAKGIVLVTPVVVTYIIIIARRPRENTRRAMHVRSQ